MNKVILLPTAALPGAGVFAGLSQHASLLEFDRITKSMRLAREKAMVRAAKLPAANDSSFVPTPGAA